MYALTEPELLDEFASVYALIFFMQTLDHFAGMSLDWPMDVRALLSALVLPTSPLHLPYISLHLPYISPISPQRDALRLRLELMPHLYNGSASAHARGTSLAPNPTLPLPLTLPLALPLPLPLALPRALTLALP